MRYGSVCSGIEKHCCFILTWVEPAFFEIEKFPRKVLEHHYPNVPLHGDFTTIKEKEYGSIELLVGGTPVSHSASQDSEQDWMMTVNLALNILGLLNVSVPAVGLGKRPWGLVIERRTDFELGALAELGYGFAYRVLDAQYLSSPAAQTCVRCRIP